MSFLRETDVLVGPMTTTKAGRNAVDCFLAIEWTPAHVRDHIRATEAEARAEGRREAVEEIRASVGEGTEVDHHGNTAVYIDDLRAILDAVAGANEPRSTDDE